MSDEDNMEVDNEYYEPDPETDDEAELQIIY